MSKSHFSRKYASLTDIGRQFGMSAVALGHRLEEASWRDHAGHKPTADSLSSGRAVGAPLRDGIPHYMWESGT